MRTIYEVNGTARYIEICWPANDNDTILAILLQHEEDTFSKLIAENISQQISYELMVDQLSSGIIGMIVISIPPEDNTSIFRYDTFALALQRLEEDKAHNLEENE